MRQAGQGALVGAAFVAAALGAAVPAQGLEIFGFRLWGRAAVEPIEVIDPFPYTIEFAVATDDEDLERELRAASALWRERAAPASGFAGLLATARGDYRRILAALYGRGHYGPDISITIAGREAADISLAQRPPAPVPVVVAVDPGPLYRFGIARIVNEPPWDEEEDLTTGPAAVGFELGEPARAGAVTQASALAIERWRALSLAKAEETGREVIADHATRLLEATVVIDPGRPARWGPVTTSGSRAVDHDFILYMADLPLGEPFSPDELADAQTRLNRLGTFSLVRIEEADEIGPDGSLPIHVRVEDRLPRSLGVGASLSTIDGIGLEAFWLHRNLFSRAEQLRFDATISGIGATDALDELTYIVGLTFVRPGTIEPNTNLIASVQGRQQNLETYDERALTGRVGLSRVFGTFFTGDLFFEVTRSRVHDDLGIRHFLTIGPVVRAQYDRRDDPLDATEGYFLLGDATTFYEAEFGNAAARATVEGRAYLGFGEERRYVLAGRARLGSYVGSSVEESPPEQLFFAGGGGSVRGYEFRSIGVESVVDGQTVTTGGRSLAEGSGEFRVRLSERFGGVGFVDAGYVAGDSMLSDGGDVRFGAGLGVRYFTGFGPLRLDVATPLNPRDEDRRVAVYIGLGQAF